MLVALGLIAGITGTAQASGVTVTDLNNGATPTGLAESLAGAGVEVSNVTYTGDNRAAGSFTGGASSIGFESGVVLDSGKVQTYSTDEPCSKGVEGPNTCYEETGGNPAGPSGSANSTGFGTPGDAELTALSGFATFDASILEFDFVPQHSTLQVSYVFSSEEYSDFANTEFNDVFAFFVNGSNCALVPGTAEAVSVNTINNGNDQGGDTTPHHAEFFRDNVRPKPTIDSQMDGLTTVLTCNTVVKEGQKNHMKLAIADASDSALDSAVFLQAGSLISGTQIKTSLSGGGQSGEKITVPEGTAVTDHATLSGADAPQATGKVTYKVFSDNKCANEVASAGTVNVAEGKVPDSEAKTLAPGVYFWQASYTGDEHNNGSMSACESEVATVEGKPSRPTILMTSLSGEGHTGDSITVKEGAAVSDNATLTGENASKAGGTATYKVYSDNKCETEVASAGTVTVTAGEVPGSEAKTLPAGTYFWRASYSGDSASNNEASKSECGAEVLKVEKGEATKETCGNTAVGAHSDSLSANLKRVNACILPTNALVSELVEYLQPASAKGQQLIEGIVYADKNGKPGPLLGVTEQLTFISTNAPGWYSLKLSSPLKLGAGKYWIGTITGATAGVAAERYTSVKNAEDYNHNAFTSGPRNPFGSFKRTSEQVSLYAVFTSD